ncbi:hypothetical protein CCMA1212_007911 [Trichoderma ghanense]|uniref:NACHT domain-containing protein n=1 Tax=Trichoderma ghanense TaxID=65468 RepID=A0ABY2GXW7_9HYPO
MPRRSISAFFKRLQPKKGGSKGSRLSTPGNILPAVSPPAELSTLTAITQTDDEGKVASCPQELWDEAYDQLKTEETKLLQVYEVILTNTLNDQNGVNVNSIKANGDERRAQLLLVIEAAQKKMHTEARVKETMGEGMKIVNSVRYIITAAVQAAPQAALPWSLVTMSLDILQNPLKQHQRNTEGISYTTKRMEWYWSLSNDLFDRAGPTNPSITPNMRNALLSRLRELYKKIILFQVKSICSYYRNRGLQLLREFAMVDDWEESLKEIRVLEQDFQSDCTAYMGLERTSLSHQIKDCLENLVALQVKGLEQQDRDCLRDLYITNPRNDRKRLLEAKGGLLPDSFNWVMESATFQQWHREKQTNLLWIKGDPGKGKTMIICGLSEELESMAPSPDLLSYFFCQGTDPNFNSATAVLRGLIYLLAIQRPSLISHLQEEYKNVGSRTLFDGVNAWVTLSGTLRRMLQDPALESACLVLDALDECDSGRKYLLDLIVESTSVAPQVKWILSSRNSPDIEAKLLKCQTAVVIDLESNDGHVADSVDAYVRAKIQQLNLIQDNEDLRANLHRAIIDKSNGTFLWAALVFKEIEELRTYDDDGEVLELLQDIPSGLVALYDRMVDQIDQLSRNDQQRCRNLLAVMATAYQPLSLETLPIMAGLKDRLARSEPLKTLIKTCGSFLTVRDNVVYFVHQSAKDYLVGEGHHRIFQPVPEAVHRDLFRLSLEALEKPGRLRPNIYSLPYPGVKTHEVSVPQPDPLAGIEYCCMYWLRHFCDGFFGAQAVIMDDIREGVDSILTFVKTHFLHWIEILSLLRNIQAGVVSLQCLVKNLSHHLDTYDSFEFFQDAARFMLHNRSILEIAPLQTYVSALIFSPTQSPVRLHFKNTLSWIKRLPKVDDDWGPCLNTLYASGVQAVAFSRDSLRLTASFYNGRGRSWDIATGDLIRDLEFSSVDCPSSTFSEDRKLLAVSSEKKTTVWDIEHGDLIHELDVDCPSYSMPRTFFSTDNQFLATIIGDESLKIWDLSTGLLLRQIPSESPHRPLAISRDFKLLATGTFKHIATEEWKAIQISDVATNNIVYELEVETSFFDDVTVFSKDLAYLVSAGKAVQVWHLPSGAEPIIMTNCEKCLDSAVFSDDTSLLALGFRDGDVEVWNLAGKVKIGSYRGHTNMFYSMAFSADAKLLATASSDETVKIWAIDLCSIHVDDPPENLRDNCKFKSTALSDDRDYVAYDSDEGNINVWHRHKDRQLPGVRRSRPLPRENAEGISLWLWQGKPVISRDSRLIALECIFSAGQFCERLHQIEVWDIDLRPIAQIPLRKWIDSHVDMAFLPDGEFLAAAHRHGEITAITIWRIETGELVSVFNTSGQVRFYFQQAGLYLATQIGCYSICRSDSEDPSSIHFTPTHHFPGFGYYLISSENTIAEDWVSWNGKGMIWLPVDFRPRECGSFSAVESEVVIGTARRDFITMEFEEPPAELGDWTPWTSSGSL